jgi:antitoxin component of MazEF toxin-antitoxin module
MTAAVEAVLDHLRDAGVTIKVRGDQLLLIPAAKVTPELAAQVRTFKPRLLSWLTWSDAQANTLIGAALERIGRACRDIPAGIVLADAEERVNVAAQHRDRDAFTDALIAYERICLAPLAAEPHRRPNRPVTSQEKKP